MAGLNFSREGYDGTLFSDFFVAKSTNGEGPGWFIYGRDKKKYGTFPDGRGRYVMLCGYRRRGRHVHYNGETRLGWRTKKEAQAILAAHLEAYPFLTLTNP
jgi:hypothetical protein